MTYRWWEHDSARLNLDQRMVEAKFPGLSYRLEGPGYLEGPLPIWPFERLIPNGVDAISPLQVGVIFGHAYPAAEPQIYPLSPEPALFERSFTQWHVLGTGALCLLQDADMWTLRAPLEELLLKAAGWRLEYELIRRGKIAEMTVAGIVSSDELDELFEA